jgi:hypothetical protein
MRHVILALGCAVWGSLLTWLSTSSISSCVSPAPSSSVSAPQPCDTSHVVCARDGEECTVEVECVRDGTMSETRDALRDVLCCAGR